MFKYQSCEREKEAPRYASVVCLCQSLVCGLVLASSDSFDAKRGDSNRNGLGLLLLEKRVGVEF